MKQRIFVLTGATRGLGRALLDELLSQEQAIVVIGRALSRLDHVPVPRTAALKKVEADLASLGDTVEAEHLSAGLQAVLAQSVFDELVFVSNAGTITPIGLVGQLGTAALVHSFAVNMIAPALIANVCRAACTARAANMKVLNISSGAATRPIAGWGSYCAAKAAARQFMDVMASENGARVEHIDPGVLDTDMQASIRAAEQQSFPMVQAFRQMAAEGALKSVDTVAGRLVHDCLQD